MKVLNFGSLNIDYVYALDHLVQPGETISAERVEVFCGGKGLNQSVALGRAGARVFHAGKIGADGDMLAEMLKSVGVDTRFVLKDELQSGHAIIQVDQTGQNSIILYHGANYRLTTQEIDSILAAFSPGDILLLQNEINHIDYIMQVAHRMGLRIMMNPAPMDNRVSGYPLELVSYFILNEIESWQLTGEKDPAVASEIIVDRYPKASCLITLGSEGALYRNVDRFFLQPAFPTKAVDTTSAGDTFTGYFVACLIKSMLPEAACKTAAMASSVCVSRKGAAVSIPCMDEVIAYLQKGTFSAFEDE